MDTNVECKCSVKVERCSAVGFFDLEAAWDQNDGEADPETSIRAKCRATKDIALKRKCVSSTE